MCGKLSIKVENRKPDYLRGSNVYMFDRHVRIWLSNRLMKKRTTDRTPHFEFERKIGEIGNRRKSLLA